MKKRSISFVMVLVMLLSAAAFGSIPHAQYFNPSIAEASVQKTSQELKTEFNKNKPFTMAMLDEAGDVDAYEIDMEQTAIPIGNFRIETITDDGKEGSCQLEFPEEVKGKGIKVGELKNTAPALLGDEDHGNGHAYSYAHVGNTEVFYTGYLTVHDGEKTDKYIVYTTDNHIDKRTVYVVLKNDEQINLVYKHGAYHTVDYQFQNMSGETIQEGREDSPWTYDKIFGHDRIRSVAGGKNFNGTITIPRGYKATVTVQRKGETEKPLHTKKLGEMMVYYQPNAGNGGYNTISLVEGSPDSMVLKDSFAIENVTSDMVVNVRYEKVNEIKFNARMWTKSTYAKDRIKIMNSNGQDEAANDTNSDLSTQGNSFTWNFNGITSLDGNTWYTWEMDQLEINGEPIAVPMVSLAATTPATTTTTLSTGTVITLTVTSLGGTNGRNAKRAYTLKAENCYEDLTVSNGNMVSHVHKEFATRALIGVKDCGYWHGDNTAAPTENLGWKPLKKNTLLAKVKDENWKGFDTFRMRLADGYQKLNVTFTDKGSNVLQTNDDPLENGTKNNYIRYLIRQDVKQDTENIVSYADEREPYGEYTEVSYDKWGPSDDGYYYCKADNGAANVSGSLRQFMNNEDKNSVVMLWFYADPMMYGIDYQNGAGGDSAPSADNIKNLPLYQNGGEDGYNLNDNTKALVSNHVPLDTSGKFIFDHWEILKAGEDGAVSEVKTDKDGNPYILEAGGNLPLSKDALDELHDCLYYNTEQKRNTLTLRAVWRSTEGKAPIPYTVNYYITEIKDGKPVGNPTLLEGHQHMANEGATLVADLWQDGNKTLSPIIQEILEKDNDQRKDYTEGGKVKYVIYEPLTNKKLEDISLDNNVVNIFLVKQPNLTIGKTVEGELGDLTKKFNFKINITSNITSDNASDNGTSLLNGTYHYTGGTVEGTSGAVAPADGTLTFTDGKAEISLSHGQQITFTDLPFGSNYIVTEYKEDGYDTVYNDNSKNYARGVLESDQKVNVKNTKSYIAVTGIAGDANRFGVMLSIGAVALMILAGMVIWRSRKKI